MHRGRTRPPAPCRGGETPPLQGAGGTYAGKGGETPPLQGAGGTYADVPGLCRSATKEEIAAQGYVLTPGRYVGAEEAEDDEEPFEEKMRRLTARLEEQFEESARLERRIRESLRRVVRDG